MYEIVFLRAWSYEGRAQQIISTAVQKMLVDPDI